MVIESLTGKGILSEQDKQDICAKKKGYSKTTLMLDILVTRSNNSYQQLVDTLKTEKQSGAVELLESIDRPKLPQTHKKLAKSFEDWLRKPNSYTHNFLLFSHNVNYSKEWVSLSAECYSTAVDLKHSDNLQQSKSSFSKTFQEQIDGYFGNLHGRFLVICDHKNKETVELSDDWKCADDTIKWSDLPSGIQKILLNRVILLQNQTINLGYILNCILTLREDAVNESDILNMIDSTLLEELVAGEVPQLADGNIPTEVNHYIHRTLRTRHRIARDVLNATRNQLSNHGDIFVIKCDRLRLYQFQSFVDKYGNTQCDLWSNQITRTAINVSTILLNNAEGFDFDDVCKRSGQRPVHLLEGITQNGEICKLLWIQSKGSMKTVQKYVHRNHDEIDEKELYEDSTINTSTTPVCISDTAGQGKTILLTHLAKQLQIRTQGKSHEQLVYVNYVPMQEIELDMPSNVDDSVFKEDSELDTRIDMNSSQEAKENYIINALVQRSSKYRIGQEFVARLLARLSTNVSNNIENSLGINIKVELIFDGIDELDTIAYEKALGVIKFIRHTANFRFPVRLWLTTRPHLLGIMEDCLETLGYEICHFTKNQQVELLTDIWMEGEDDKIQRDSMRKIAEETLEKLNEKVSQPDESEDVAGLPLLCVLLAEVFKRDARRICLQNQTESDFNQRISDLTISQIYKQYIDTRFQSVNEQLSTETINNVHLCHIEKALQMNFWKSHHLDILLPSEPLQNQELFAYGIVQPGSHIEPVKFIHKTFASYFSAQAVVKMLEYFQSVDIETGTMSEVEPSFALLDKIICVEDTVLSLSTSERTPLSLPAYKFKHHTICYFLDFWLTSSINVENILKLLQKSLCTDKLVNYIKYIWQYLVAAIVANHYNIAFTLVQAITFLFQDYATITKFFSGGEGYAIPDLVQFSAKCASKDLIKLVCKFNNIFMSTPVNSYKFVYRYHNEVISRATLTPLHITFEAGNLEGATFLLSEEGFLHSIKSNPFDYRCLLHSCIASSVGNRRLIVSNKKDIINLLATICPSLYVRNYVNKGVELERMRLELLLEYLKVRENIKKSMSMSCQEIVGNKYGENIMHLLPQGHYDDEMTAQKYHETLVQLLDIFKPVLFLKYVYAKNAFDWRAIDIAASKLDLLPETLKLLENLQTQSKIINKEHLNLLKRLKKQSAKLISKELQLHSKLLRNRVSKAETEKLIFQLNLLQGKKSQEEILEIQVTFGKLEKQKEFVNIQHVQEVG